MSPRIALISILWLAALGCSSAEPRAPAAPPLYVPLEVPLAPVLPAEDYRVGPQDVLAIRVLDLESPGQVSTYEPEVSVQGDVALPFIGALLVAGKTAEEIRRELVARLGEKFLVDPQVTVAVKEYRSRRVSVTGAVARPGVFFMNRNRVSVVEALTLAGGLAKEAGARAVVVRPPGAGARATPGAGAREPDRIEVDLIALLLRGDPRADVLIEPGWVLQVPPAEEFFVSGYVNHPGAFPYQRPTSVLRAVALAGGLNLRKASPSAVEVRRPGRGGEVEVIEVDLDAIAAGEAPDIPIYAGDSVIVGRTWTWAFYTEVIDTALGTISAGLAGFFVGRF